MLRNTSDTNAEANIAEAAEQTGLLIRNLQLRLQDRAGDFAAEPADETCLEETAEDLERQLQEFFQREGAKGAPHQTTLNEIRSRVIDGVVERIMLEWDRPRQGLATPLETQVIERLIARVLERLNSGGAGRR